MQYTDTAHIAALRELAGRIDRSLVANNGRVYWKPTSPSGLREWFIDVLLRSPYSSSDASELCLVLHMVCGVVLDDTDGSTQVTLAHIELVIAARQWANVRDANPVRWLQEDESRVNLIDDHLESGSIWRATALAQDKLRREMAHLLLAALKERSAAELAAWMMA